MVDGKHMREAQIVIALGITEHGKKMPLSFVQTNTENCTAIKGLFKNLINRGFKCEDGLLTVIDGAKGLFIQGRKGDLRGKGLRTTLHLAQTRERAQLPERGRQGKVQI